MTYWLELDDPSDVAAAAADTIEEHARHAIQQRGVFKLVLAGGSTPGDCYRILAQRDLQWDKWKLFYGDERCLPLHNPERNHQMVVSSGLTQHVNSHFIIAAELGAEKAAQNYTNLILDQMPFDLVLLGMGEDGHTASLFPGHSWGEVAAQQPVIPVYDSPKPPPERVSLTPYALQNCLQMLVLVTGDSKRQALQRWKHGDDLPVARVADLDQAAVYLERRLLE
jgi:6-phosphogluconolactonase